MDAASHYAVEQESLASSSNLVSNMTELSGVVMDSLSSQRRKLKGTQKRLVGLARSLGVSDNLVRLIERRDFMDRLLVYGGIVFTLLFFFTLLYLVRWKKTSSGEGASTPSGFVAGG